jgi:hypothetical protein
MVANWLEILRKEDPNHADGARDYGDFLPNVRQDSAVADVFDKRPTVTAPTNVNEFGF